jgi:hypothetical protein
MIRNVLLIMDDGTVERLKREFDRLAEEGERLPPPEELEEA